MEVLIPLIAIAVVLIVVGCGLYFSWRYEQKRTQTIEEIAGRLGFDFIPLPAASTLERLQQMELFQRGRGNKASNYLHRATDEVDVLIFDHQYTISSGKNSHTYKQSVVAIQSDQLDLPDFVISPEHFFHKIVTALGYQDIDFDEFPQFSKRFLLRGPDEAAIRQKLQRVNLERVADFAGICIEARNSHFLVWHPGKRSKPEDLLQLFEKAFEVYVMFKA